VKVSGIFVGLLLALWAAPRAKAEQKQALIVSINDYGDATKGACNLLSKQSARGFVMTKPGDKTATPACPDKAMPPLSNANGDGDQFERMVMDRFRYSKSEIQRLRDRQATAEAMMKALRGHIARLGKGDRFLFYFAGHGVQIANARGGKQEGLAPWDYEFGAYPIFDFELMKIYQEAIRKGVQLTVVLDSCFAGGTARGVRYRSVTDYRTLDTVPPPFDRSGPFALLAGARGEQPATDEAMTFTQALVDVVQNNPADLSVAELARMTEVRMAGKQSPVSDGGASERVNVVGEPVQRDSVSYRVTLVTQTSGEIMIDGGQVNGLTAGSEFALESDKASRYHLVALEPAGSKLRAIAGSPLPKAGARVKLVRWQNAELDGMQVYVPSLLPAEADVARLRACLVNTDPGLLSKGPSGHHLTWGRSGWQLTLPDGKAQPFRCENVEALRGVGLTVAIPPTKELRENLEKDLGAYKELLRETHEAPYEVVGRLHEGRLEYALAKRFTGKEEMLPVVSEWNRDWTTKVNSKGIDEPDRYPAETEKTDCTGQSGLCAQMLARRIQRTRILMDLRRMEASSSRIITAAGVERIPWRIEMREKAGDACTQKVLSEIVAMTEYCLVAAYTGPPGSEAGWYLHVVTIDGAGLLSSLKYIDKRYADDVPLDKRFYSMPSEGNRENFFLFATTQGSLSQLTLTDEFQRPPIPGSGRSRELKKPTVRFNSAGARGESQPTWTLTSTTIPVLPKN